MCANFYFDKAKMTAWKSLPKEEWKDSVQTTRALTLIKKDL